MATESQSRLIISIIPLVLITFFTVGTAKAEMMFKYKSSAVGEIDTTPECYDPDSVGKVGSAPDCEGMLIVDDRMLRSAASEHADPDGHYQSDGGGHGDFQVIHDSIAYSFVDSPNNVFTGQVQDMSFLFFNTNFDEDIGYWDTSSVTEMRDMFHRNHSFDHDISDWDVSNVKSIYRMFEDTPISADIGKWDVSNVTNMYGVFQDSSFNRDIGDWDVSNVESMHYMFKGSSFDQDIGDWDVSNVTAMPGMFENAPSFDQDLSGWCVSEFPSKPSDFDSGAWSWNKALPDWGNCPN